MPSIIHAVVHPQNEAIAPLLLSLFCINSAFAITIMGGTLAVLPAYESDLYGPKYVGAIHSRFLLSTTVASIIGPTMLLSLRSSAERSAIFDLASKVE